MDNLGTKPEFLRELLAFQQEYGDRLYKNGFEIWERDGPGSHRRCFFHTHAEGEVCHLK